MLDQRLSSVTLLRWGGGVCANAFSLANTVKISALNRISVVFSKQFRISGLRSGSASLVAVAVFLFAVWWTTFVFPFWVNSSFEPRKAFRKKETCSVRIVELSHKCTLVLIFFFFSSFTMMSSQEGQLPPVYLSCGP